MRLPTALQQHQGQKVSMLCSVYMLHMPARQPSAELASAYLFYTQPYNAKSLLVRQLLYSSHAAHAAKVPHCRVARAAHLVADGAAVHVVEALQHVAQRADGALLAQEALHVPGAQEEPGMQRGQCLCAGCCKARTERWPMPEACRQEGVLAGPFHTRRALLDEATCALCAGPRLQKHFNQLCNTFQATHVQARLLHAAAAAPALLSTLGSAGGDAQRRAAHAVLRHARCHWGGFLGFYGIMN